MIVVAHRPIGFACKSQSETPYHLCIPEDYRLNKAACLLAMYLHGNSQGGNDGIEPDQTNYCGLAKQAYGYVPLYSGCDDPDLSD